MKLWRSSSRPCPRSLPRTRSGVEQTAQPAPVVRAHSTIGAQSKRPCHLHLQDLVPTRRQTQVATKAAASRRSGLAHRCSRLLPLYQSRKCPPITHLLRNMQFRPLNRYHADMSRMQGMLVQKSTRNGTAVDRQNLGAMVENMVRSGPICTSGSEEG